jgi:hypothetical protein
MNMNLLLIATLCLTLSACKKDEKASAKEEDTPAPAPVEKDVSKTEQVPSTLPEGVGGFAADLMQAYETCRALLASDKTDGIAGCAGGIAAAAEAATEGAPDSAKASLASIKTAAEALANAPADDIEKLRVAYGDVSKEVLALLGAAPEIGSSFHIFECPMANGYKRWAQVDSKISNPYMGSKMLECGAEVAPGAGKEEEQN